MREKCDFSSPSTLDNHLAVKTRYMAQELYFHDRWRVDPKKVNKLPSRVRETIGDTISVVIL